MARAGCLRGSGWHPFFCWVGDSPDVEEKRNLRGLLGAIQRVSWFVSRGTAVGQADLDHLWEKRKVTSRE